LRPACHSAYGEQEGSAYNGHFGCTCYHPLFVFNQLGDLERSAATDMKSDLGVSLAYARQGAG
jgi:Transposase DDE domain group 1